MRLLVFVKMLAFGCLVGAMGCPGFASPDRGPQQSADSLWAEGDSLLEGERPEEAAGKFLAAIELDPKHAPSYVGLGHAYLAQDSLKAAEDAFRNALRRKKNYPQALNGLGLVFRQTPKGMQWAIKYFRKAIQADKTYEEAYYSLAQTYLDVGNTRALDTYKKLVKVVPDHPDAWFQIGKIHTDGIGTLYRDSKKAETSYRRQLEVNQRHFGARYRLGLVLIEGGQDEEGTELLQTVVDTPNVYQRRGVLALAERYQARRKYDRSELLFDAYIEGLDSKEQEPYHDLSLVVEGEDLRRFRDSSRDQWKLLSDRFWAGRDPAPVTAANERRIEHCRRVAYARGHFGEHKFPWDDRGEVYVRYGEPDHVSSSVEVRFETDPRVVAVKDRLTTQAGRALGPLLMERAGLSGEDMGDTMVDGKKAIPVGSASTIRRQIAETGHRLVSVPKDDVVAKGASKAADLAGASSILGWPVYPVVDKAWEYWIYTDVGPGIEVTFVQAYYPGPFSFVEMPFGIGASDGTIVRTWRRMNPRVVLNSVAAKTPEVYRPDFATGPLDFYFDSARFRGEEESTDLEAYYGIPTRDLDFVAGDEGRSTAHIKRGIAIYDVDGRSVHRSAEDMELYSEEEADTTQLAFIPELDRVALLPGTYRLSVQILDTSSEKSQVYNQQITLDPFGHEGLRLSDIQLAASIRQATEGKFLKGDIDVVPNPSRGYLPGQPVFIYYEIYNLKQDEFGATQYRVSYELRSLEKKSVGARVLGGLGRLLGQRQEAETIVIEYEHVGDQSDDHRYLQLDMSDTEPGEQILKVRVTDGNAGTSVVGSSTFTIQ